MTEKPVLNIYGVLDNELSRLHRLIETFMVHNDRSRNQDRYTSGTTLGNPFTTPIIPFDINAVYNRIIEIHDVILNAVSNSESKIQEAVAELALTGKGDVWYTR